MKKTFNNYKSFLKEKYLVYSTLISFIFLALCISTNYMLGLYVVKKESNSVTDIILSNTRVYDVDQFFVWGTFLFIIFVFLFCIKNPYKIPYLIKSTALFILIRSIFMSLTHLAPFPERILLEPSIIISKMSFGADLFFSGHTGLPFLMSLIFWQNKILRYTFLFLSIFFGIIVLLGHIHYSIDVLAAFFITYTIHDISKYLFKKDLIYFRN